ncbi:MAG: VWA domain-containing protein [Bacilli bacterium]|jgi:Mg-chelatase subunit ChlD|nr:VWA domain-containing protein [Bacilli bacterium]
MNNIKIQYPYLFYIAIPLVIIAIIGFFLLPKQKRTRPKNIISLALHFVMIATLCCSFVNIQFLHTSTDTEMYVLVDCSASEEESAAHMDELVDEVKKQAVSGTKVGVVAFAKDAKVLVKPGAKISSTLIQDVFKDDGFDKDSTNLASALSFTNDLYSDSVIRRMVIISDGQETDGKAVNEVDKLLTNDVTIDTISLQHKPGDEVAITGLDYVDYAYLNREQNVKVSIDSQKEEKITVELTSEGEVLKSQEVRVNKGLNVVTFPLLSSEAGTKNYSVTLKGTTDANDTYKQNNIMSFSQNITDKFKVLLIGSVSTDTDALKALNMYTSNTVIDSYIGGTNVPYTLDELNQYDEFVLSDANLTNYNHYKDLIKNLNTSVSVYGKSLWTFGATYTDMSQDAIVSTYNDMLPIQYQSDGGKALVLLIDVSGSMESDNRLTKAKQGAIACLDILGDKDYVSVVSFSDDAKTVVPLMSVKNRTQIIAAINKMQTDGGTEMGVGLSMCWSQLKNADFDEKHVITLSDGDPFDSEASLRSLVFRMSNDNISCSFINISNSSGAALLKMLALYGNGAYYYASTSAQLVNIILSSVSDEVTNTVIEKKSSIQYRKPDDPTLTNVVSLPDINGYNYCRIKAAATTVLTVQYIKDVSGSEAGGIAAVPIYAYWSYGQGNVASFTSSLSSNWTSDFRTSKNGMTFFRNAATQLLPNRNTTLPVEMTYTNNGITSTVNVTPSNGDFSGTVHLNVKDTDGQEAEYDLFYDGKSSYAGDISTPKSGKYDVTIHFSYHKDGAEELTAADPVEEALYFNYSKEYNTFDEDSDVLYKLSKQNGTYNTDKVALSTLDSELQYKSYDSSAVWFLLATVILFLIDIFIRKSDFRPREKKNKNKNTLA